MGEIKASVESVTKVHVTPEASCTVTDLSEIVPGYEPGQYRLDPPKELDGGVTYVLTLNDDGTALLRLPYPKPIVEDMGTLQDLTLGLAASGGNDDGSNSLS